MEIPCSVSATPAVTSVQWQFTSNSGNTITITQSTSKYTVGSDMSAPNLTVNSAALSDAGSYACSATNIVGTGSDTATLTITGSKSQCGDLHNIGFLWSAQCFFFLGKTGNTLQSVFFLHKNALLLSLPFFCTLLTVYWLLKIPQCTSKCTKKNASMSFNLE